LGRGVLARKVLAREVLAREVSARTTKGRAGRPPAIGLGMLLRTADMDFNRHLRDELARYDVTFGQFQHLRNLWAENGLTQAELSRRIGIEMASSTAILDSLEARRLITRVRNATDRRKINIFLTPAGAALKKPLMACAARVNKEARRGLTDAELASVFALVGRIIANLEAMRAADAGIDERARGRRPTRQARA
jgi:MarR family transcriptional regulator, organic hydroperoxide resistance regulator